MDGLLYRLVLMPLALLPLRVLYWLSDVLYMLAYYVVRYRRKVTRCNLQRSFPDWDDHEIKSIERRYYHHMTDLLAEAVYGLRATPQKVLRHYHVTNRELANQYYERGQSIILMSAHYNNWEFMVLSLGMQFLHHGIGVGKPLDQKNMARLMTANRTRYGTQVVDQTDVRQEMAYFEEHHVPCAYMMLGDQSPSNAHRSHWTTFLNQDTAFLYGAEHFARKYHYPVLCYRVDKVRRGYYEVTLSELCTDIGHTPEGEITERYARWLETTIRNKPEYWLWSHRRWKLRRDGRRIPKKEYCNTTP